MEKKIEDSGAVMAEMKDTSGLLWSEMVKNT